MTIILDGTTGITTPAINSSGDLELPGGTANGVLYLNGSKVATSGSALVFDGTNLGVGTSSPGFKLHVNDTAIAIQGASFPALKFLDGSGNTDSEIYFGAGGGDDLNINNYVNGPMIFRTNNVERARITAGGSFGIGVTPQAWASAVPACQIKSAAFAGTDTQILLSQNYYFDGSDRYIANGAATLYQQTGGAHLWYTAASGTAGNTISFTERARIDSSGNLLVGTTSTTGNGNFANAYGIATLAAGSDGRTYTKCQDSSASNNATVDAFRFTDAAGNIIGTGYVVGHFYVYVTGASGANAFSGVYSVVTTGNGNADATFASVSTVGRGTSPVSSVQITSDGVGGAIKLTITYINNAGVVTGGNARVSFVGLCRQN